MTFSIIDRWHAYMDNPSRDALDAMLHEDCVFLSPVVFTPQQGKAATMSYLLAAGGAFDNTDFRYISKIETDNRAVMEFECTMDGKYVNGIDIIDYDDDGLITQFKVLVRPLQAVNAVWEQMGRQLDRAKTA